MMDQIFDWCVRVLVYWAGVLGITYKEINVWVFVIIWPIFTIILVAIILWQQRALRQLRKKNNETAQTGRSG
jgi:hypothetical protein